jgi:putative endonuclease
VGCSADVNKRLSQHNAGLTKSTKPHIPFEIIYTEAYPSITECKKREIAIKKNHALKKSLIPGLK